MKKFYLKEALAGKPVVSRDGRDVTQLVKFKTNDGCTLVGLLDGYIYSWTTIGECVNGLKTDADLFMKPIKKEGYVNIYKGALIHSSEDEARMNSGDNLLITVKVEWEE